MNGLTVNIRCLEELVSSHLEKEEKVVGSDVSRLTAPGENFGSIVLRLLIKIKNKLTGKTRTLDAVGKIIPESKRVQEMFNTQVTFRNEYKFYAQVVPILDKFLKNKGLQDAATFVPKFFGGRINLNNNDEVDNDAIILMENLKSAGFSTGKKTEGLDLEQCKMTINSLASFHTVGLALRLEDPKCFEEKLQPYFSDYIPEDDLIKIVSRNLVYTLENNGFTNEEIEKVQNAMSRDCRKKNISDIWGTMIHYDTWTNNILIKYKEDTPIKSSIVDFQDFGYGSPLNDLMFFFLSSIPTYLLNKNLDILLDYYFEKFLENLKTLKMDTKPYTRQSFDQEVTSSVKKYEYCHTMWMLIPIMHEGLTGMDELDKEDECEMMKWSEKHVQKIVEITRVCLERQWL